MMKTGSFGGDESRILSISGKRGLWVCGAYA